MYTQTKPAKFLSQINLEKSAIFLLNMAYTDIYIYTNKKLKYFSSFLCVSEATAFNYSPKYDVTKCSAAYLKGYQLTFIFRRDKKDVDNTLQSMDPLIIFYRTARDCKPWSKPTIKTKFKKEED